MSTHFVYPSIHFVNSMFLQNMMVVWPYTTVDIILWSKPRDGDDRSDLLSTLLAAIRANSTNVDLAECIFGLLSIVALDAIGGASLKGLDADSLAMDAIRNHPDSSRLHEAAFALLHSTIADFDGRINDFAKEILDSIETHPGEEMLQVNAIRFLRVVVSREDGTCAAEGKGLVRSERGRRILAMASASFPNSCKELVDSLLHEKYDVVGI